MAIEDVQGFIGQAAQILGLDADQVNLANAQKLGETLDAKQDARSAAEVLVDPQDMSELAEAQGGKAEKLSKTLKQEKAERAEGEGIKKGEELKDEKKVTQEGVQAGITRSQQLLDDGAKDGVHELLERDAGHEKITEFLNERYSQHNEGKHHLAQSMLNEAKKELENTPKTPENEEKRATLQKNVDTLTQVYKKLGEEYGTRREMALDRALMNKVGGDRNFANPLMRKAFTDRVLGMKSDEEFRTFFLSEYPSFDTMVPSFHVVLNHCGTRLRGNPEHPEMIVLGDTVGRCRALIAAKREVDIRLPSVQLAFYQQVREAA